MKRTYGFRSSQAKGGGFKLEKWVMNWFCSLPKASWLWLDLCYPCCSDLELQLIIGLLSSIVSLLWFWSWTLLEIVTMNVLHQLVFDSSVFSLNGLVHMFEGCAFFFPVLIPLISFGLTSKKACLDCSLMSLELGFCNPKGEGDTVSS